MKARRSLSALGIVATALGWVVLAAGPASASSGGGCGLQSGDVKACISAIGDHVEPDLYVANLTGSCSQITYFLFDDTTNTVVYGKKLGSGVGCLTPGHYYPGPIIGVNGHNYHSTAVETLTSGASASSKSPELNFSA